MYQAFNTAVSGLQANQLRMEVIGNNIANVNTTAYKASRATFEEMFAQTLQMAQEPLGNRGGINPMQVGMGTKVSSIDTIHTQGNLTATGKNTDIAIQGGGFLMLNDENGAQLFTRDGNLALDGNGILTTNTGLYVQGWQADGRGVVNTNGSTSSLYIDANKTIPPQASSRVDLVGNLYRPPRMNADEAHVHARQNGITAAQNITAYGNAAGGLQLGTLNNDSLDAGELVINNISILGELPLDLTTGETTETVMQKLADLINFHQQATGVIATVKSTSLNGNPVAQLSLTSVRAGSDQQITLGGSAVQDILLNGEQVFPGLNNQTLDTSIETFSPNAGVAASQTTAGSISLVSGDILINGIDIGPLAATPASNTAEQNAQLIIGLINAKTDLSGVRASSDGNGNISLQATARDIILTGRTVSDGAPGSDTFGILAGDVTALNVSGLSTSMNAAKNATVVAGTTSSVFDSLGDTHTVGLEFVSDYDVVVETVGGTSVIRGTRDNGIWNWAATSDNPDVAVLSGLSSPVNAGDQTGIPLRSVGFSDQGLLENFTGRFTLNFLNSDAVTSTSIFAFNTNLSPNINHPQPMTVDVGTLSDTDGLTQFAGTRSISVANQDGYAAGEMVSFGFTPDGKVRGVFTNGKTLTMAQVAIASFANEGGLVRGNISTAGGGNVYQASANSGDPRIGVAQANGNGAIIGGVLESSNVDLAEQFTDMIVTQRAFQANSRTITTADEMLQEVLSLRR
ncbi:MAG: flagellar hook-basal body complex protein [Candidatus Sericytochromatia bacterium]|nr:flagellar hook-basal body complex protein [Candidatus Sericytochromatia bacterium]